MNEQPGIKLSPSLFLIPGENQGRFPYSFSLFIEGEVRTLIDLGAGKGLSSFSKENIDGVILSHFHPDHVQQLERFQGVPFFVHEADAPPLLGMEGFCQYTGLHQLGEDWISHYPLPISFLPEIHRYYQDGEVLDFGGVYLRVIHTPGHSPGHSAFYHEERGLLFTGDLDLTRFGPWYGYPSSDIRSFLDSIQKLSQLEAQTLVSSHKGILTGDPQTLLENYQRVIFSREERIRESLTIPRTREALLKESFIYGDISSNNCLLSYFEGVFLDKHLEYLFYRGLVKKEGEYYVSTSG